jgi:hypothetical protein
MRALWQNRLLTSEPHHIKVILTVVYPLRHGTKVFRISQLILATDFNNYVKG